MYFSHMYTPVRMLTPDFEYFNFGLYNLNLLAGFVFPFSLIGFNNESIQM